MANVLIKPHRNKIFQTSGRCYQTHAPRKLGQARAIELGIGFVVSRLAEWEAGMCKSMSTADARQLDLNVLLYDLVRQTSSTVQNCRYHLKGRSRQYQTKTERKTRKFGPRTRSSRGGVWSTDRTVQWQRIPQKP